MFQGGKGQNFHKSLQSRYKGRSSTKKTGKCGNFSQVEDHPPYEIISQKNLLRRMASLMSSFVFRHSCKNIFGNVGKWKWYFWCPRRKSENTFLYNFTHYEHLSIIVPCKTGIFSNQIKSSIWWPEMARAGKNLVPLSEYVRSSHILQLTT